jgi:hypothetical protein
MVDHVIFIITYRSRPHHDVVALLRFSLRRGTVADVAQANVLDDHLCIVLLPPLFGIGSAEPFVVARDEMLEFQDFERLLLRRCPPRNDARRHTRGRSRTSC